MPHARHTDPHTSHEAAKSVQNLTLVQTIVLALLAEPMTDEQLVQRYTDLFKAAGDIPGASQSGIRTRRSELAERGLVEIVDHSRTRSGRRAHVWQMKAGN